MASLIERFRNLSTPQKALAGLGALVVVLGVTAGVIAATGGDDPEPTTTSGPTTTTTAPPPAPLTGLPVDDQSILERPAISVKLGNNPEARPQEGLNDADLVFEEEVEGRITRFLSVFHSQDLERAGPVRSVRLMDALIAQPIGGMFVYSGGANVPERISRLDAAGVRHFNEDQLMQADARILDPDHGNGVRPNILFADLQQLWEVVTDAAPPQPQFSYLDEGEAFTGQDAPIVRIPVGTGGYNPTWRWDEDEGVWLRFYGDEPFETKGGDQVAFENLVVQFVGRSGEESIVTGEGQAYVLSDGKMIQGTWRRPGPEAPAEFLDQNGNEIRLTPGKTWIHLPLAGGGDVTVEGAAATETTG